MNRNIQQIVSRCTAALAATALAAIAAPVVEPMEASAATLLFAEFETTNDSFGPRGGESVAWGSAQAYADNCSLCVSDRTAAWNGAAREASSFMKAGNTYALSAAVYQASGEAIDMKFSLQYKADGETQYADIVVDTVQDSTWTILSNPAYTVPEGATDLVIYLETVESLTDFYVDNVTVKGAPATIKQGDANGDLMVNVLDLVHLNKYLLCVEEEAEPGADMNGDGEIDVYDLALLKRQILNPPKAPSISGDWDNYQENVSPAELQILKDGLYRVGNTDRLREKIAKAQAGETVNVAYLGGSITAGGSSSSANNCYAALSYQYFSETFGTGSNVNYINAGLAGTSSVVGNMRVDQEVLAKKADIIFIEFAVNDQDGTRFQKSYDSLVRKCLSDENAPAVVLITLCTESGGSCQDWMAKVGENYDLPVISGKNAIQNAIKAGTKNWKNDYGSGDNIHPGNGGHRMIADCINYYFRQALRSENASDPYEIPSTDVYGSELSTAKLMTLDEMRNLNKGSWTSGTNNQSYSQNGFTFSKNGNTPLTFTTEGKGILLLFQSNDNASMGTVNVTVNGKTNPVTAKLPWTWGGMDGDIAYMQDTSGELNVSISMQDAGTSFVLYGIAVVK